MKIAVNASCLKEYSFENNKSPYINSLLQLVLNHPEQDFIFISDMPFSSEINFPDNIIPVVTRHEANTPLKLRLWYNFKIPAILKKYKADIFISEHFCSLNTKIPQILFSPDLTFIHKPSFINKKFVHFYKKYTPLFLQKADTIVVFSNFLKNELITHYKTKFEKIKVIHQNADLHLSPIDFEKREKIKEEYTDGNEYFIYKGVISPQKNLLNLLKAFSAFKKRQKSSMFLVILGNPGPEYENFKESLRLYRFNKEVKLIDNLSKIETEKIISSAYCMVYAPVYETLSITPLEAMECEVPVIASRVGSLSETCGDAALYVDPDNFKDIAEKMMLMFKDEKARKEWIEKGKVHSLKYRSVINPGLFEIIETIAKKNPVN